MEDKSPSAIVASIENQIHRTLRPVNILKLNKAAQEALVDLRQMISDSKIYVTDYELSETREEQIKSARLAKKYLDKSQKDILIASEYNIFGAVDVAQLTAQIDKVQSSLK